MTNVENITRVGLKYLSNGFSVIPVILTTKKPYTDEWGKYSYDRMTADEFTNAIAGRPSDNIGLAMLMGGEHNFTCIDIDCKYDNTGQLYNNLKLELGKDILKDMYVNSTQNNGYHFIFKCSEIGINTKLATRPVTKEEKLSYLESITSDDSKDVNDCLRAALGYESKVLLETRAKGGYILIPPSPGYTHVYGKVIKEISVDTYNTIMDTCRSFNTYIKKETPYHSKAVGKSNTTHRTNVFKNFNNDCDKIELLASFGWRVVGTSPEGYLKILRPGTDSGHSAYYNPVDHAFWVFSTSTRFPEQKLISAVDILFELKYQSDPERSGELLDEMIELGYGN